MQDSPQGEVARPLPGWVEAPLRRPRTALLALLALTGALATGIPRLELDPSTERVFPDGHWAVTTFERFRGAFGGDESLLVVLEVDDGDVFRPDVLGRARALAREAARLDGVQRAMSLPDLPVIRVVPGFGPMLVRPLPDDLRDVAPEALAAWRHEVLSLPYVERFLVSSDHRALSVVLLLDQIPPGPAGAARNEEIVAAVLALADEAAREPGVAARVAGTPLLKAEIMAAIRRDMLRFSGPLLLIALVAAGLVLRSAAGTALVLLVLGASVTITLGAMGHAGVRIDTMTSLVPVLLLVIGVADALHLLVEQRAQAALLGPGATGAASMQAALRHVLVPCLLTSVTTAVGFGSLVLSPIPPIRAFGVAAALAALTAFAVTVVLVPALAALLPAPRAKPGQVVRMDRLAGAVVRRPRASLALGVLFTLACGLGWLRLEQDTDFLSFFPRDSRVRADALRIQERFIGIAPCELLVEGPPGTSRRPEALAALLAFERDLEREVPFVDLTFSVADCVAVAHGLTGGPREVPADAAQVERLERLLQGLAGGELPFERLISAPGGAHPEVEWLRVGVRAQAVGSTRMSDLVAAVRRLEAAHLAPVGLKATPTGTAVVFSQTAETIMKGQVESFALAFVVIVGVMTCALRSLRLGALSTIPNVVPIVALIGAMGLLGIPFNSFNSMVASIALGIAVDDTIHVLLGYKRFSADRPLDAAVHETIAHEGMAVTSTSLVLAAGFSVLLLASFAPTAQFGLLTVVAIGAALLGDLVLTPALLLLASDRRAAA
ncbi:MAG: MMPL family transporter [Planctomycetes bacterium]|nr:MMPL family transporter [Planctomycetota bacterium]